MSALYTLHSLVRRFGDRVVLDIPELSLGTRTIYGLLGPNGAGKTTLMRILSFMDTPTEGDIEFMGERVDPAHAARYRARVVWVPQSPVLFTGSLLYNIEYPMRLKGIARHERRSRAMELLAEVGLERLAKAPGHRLSGGEAQRASIARALAAGAEVILFDEPTASVDFRSRGEIIRIIHELWESRGLSVMVTTHDFELAAELCQEHITLFEGRIVSQYPLQSGVALPLGIATQPGRLSQDDSGLTVRLGVKAGGHLLSRSSSACHVRLKALTETLSGVALRVIMDSGASLDVLVSDPTDIALARTLTLGVMLRLENSGT